MAEHLEQLLQSADSTVELLRNADLKFNQYVFPDEYTNWIEEQRAIRESCAIVDQSFHMEPCFIEGSESIDFLERIAVNNFSKIRNEDPPQAINLLLCNPDGYIIGDQILFHLNEGMFSSVGSVWANNWIRYTAETMSYNVKTETPYGPYMEDTTPPKFRFQIQGPNAFDVMADVTDGSIPEIQFFQMKMIEINGHDIYALGHGMAATPGLEIFGPYKYHGEVLDDILAAGQQYGIQQLGSKAYKTGKIGSGWLVGPVPAIYDNEEMKGYREWLDADGTEATFSIGGSFVSDDIQDYYMTPMERGQSHLVSFDHDFVGKAEIKKMINDPQRERVTFVWNDQDVIDVYASLFQDGGTKKFINLPDTANTWSKTHYDRVEKNGEIVGVSKYPGYLCYEREMLSLGTIDRKHSEPGTEVTFVWGDYSNKQRVERHEPTEIGATVGPAPYVTGGRESM